MCRRSAGNGRSPSSSSYYVGPFRGIPVCRSMRPPDRGWERERRARSGTIPPPSANMKAVEWLYSPSLDLDPKTGTDLPKCEIDFVWLIPRPYPQKTAVLIGECKDRGGKSVNDRDKGPVSEKDIENLKRVADALPQKRFNALYFPKGPTIHGISDSGDDASGDGA